MPAIYRLVIVFEVIVSAVLDSAFVVNTSLVFCGSEKARLNKPVFLFCANIYFRMQSGTNFNNK